MIEFRPVTRHNFQQVANLRVAAYQEDFVDSAIHSLAQAYVIGEACKPFAIYHNDNVIGFIMFRYGLGHKRTEIASIIIDKNYQSQGYGTKAIQLAIDLLTNEGKTRVVQLDYNPSNLVAKHIYEQQGFSVVKLEDNGEILMERNLWHSH